MHSQQARQLASTEIQRKDKPKFSAQGTSGNTPPPPPSLPPHTRSRTRRSYASARPRRAAGASGDELTDRLIASGEGSEGGGMCGVQAVRRGEGHDNI